MRKTLAVALIALTCLVPSRLFGKGTTTKVLIEGQTFQSLLKSPTDTFSRISTFGQGQGPFPANRRSS